MNLILNGESREVPSGLNLDEVLRHLSLPTQRIAVEVNRMVVRRSEWINTEINEKDQIEIVHFVGGG